MDKQEIETPALLVDLNRMEGNLHRMAAFFRTVPAKLRPHFKNHKCSALAARQLDAGAIGMTCATIGEAECLVQHGVPSILIANEIVEPAKIHRLIELVRQADVIVCVDNEKNLNDLARAGRNAGTPVSVLVDVDVGLHRCGVQPGDPALRLARLAVEKHLRLRGLMGYEGHLSRQLPGPDKEEAVAVAMRSLMGTKACLERENLPVEIVSAGATGTYSISGCYPGVTEIQAGSYLFMDTNYRKCCPDFDLTLTILTTVVSKTDGERIVVDAGLKTLSCERGLPIVRDIDGLTIHRLTAEHGIIDLDTPSVPVQVGDRIEIWVPYSDATVNLHERMYGIRKGRVEEILVVDGGRGR
jgi:D-serine deaminase-like pyridoxal phosphate-dependent protein